MLRRYVSEPKLVINVQNWPRAAQGLVLGVTLALGGCSAELLRFDAPVFNLNGDTAGGADLAQAPAGDSLYDQRDAVAGATAAPVASVDRSTPVASERPHPVRVADAAPIVATPSHNTSPVTTGALVGRQSVTVSAGDTLYSLSRRYGVTVPALRDANGLASNVIRPGQVLALPGGNDDRRTTTNVGVAGYSSARTQAPSVRDDQQPSQSLAGDSYTVQPGDSLYAISRRTGVSVGELKRINGIADVRSLRPGQRLTLGGSNATQIAVASRTETEVRPVIRSKSIRTMPISRTPGPSVGQPPNDSPASSVAEPRILNQRPQEPIITKPQQQAALAPAAVPDEKFRWPARGRIIGSFNHSGQGTKNDGINIAMPIGTEVAAAADGVVAYAGSELKGYGNLILVRHDNGWVSAYAHASELLVKRGDSVRRGQIIAKAGNTGDVTQPQLHFELRKGAKPVDPLPHMAQL